MLTGKYLRKQTTETIAAPIEPLFPVDNRTVILPDEFKLERIPNIGVNTSQDTIELLYNEAYALEKTLTFIENCKQLEKKLLKKLKVITKALQSLEESDQISEKDVDILAVSQATIELESSAISTDASVKSLAHVNDFDK
jgi:hypothetical protein